MNEKYVKLRDQLWTYQKREAEILARENALYQEKEEAQKQVGELLTVKTKHEKLTLDCMCQKIIIITFLIIITFTCICI